MAKRVFLQLAHPVDFNKHIINSAYASEKMDGMRAFWDGGITRGLPASTVPWANTAKDHIRTTPPVATGLWSRYGNVIHAAASFLDSLPPFMLDGELYLGPQRFQDIISICRSLDAGDRWDEVRFMVLDAPWYKIMFTDGEIKETNYKKVFKDIIQWIEGRKFVDPIPQAAHGSFYNTLSWLDNNLVGSCNVQLTSQEKLPSGTDQARARVEEKLTEVLAYGGEGVIIKRRTCLWTPERSHDVMKYKPENDDEAIVKGYIWGRETALGSKLLGLMGAMILDYKGKRLELSGFTDEERQMTFKSVDPTLEGEELGLAKAEGHLRPGQEASAHWSSDRHPIGSRVTFKYRELTRDGVPKEARFFRKRLAGT